MAENNNPNTAVPRVSVVIPTHNRPNLLAEALASLDAQTFHDWEAIIVDDGSTPPVDLTGRFGKYYDANRLRIMRHDVAVGVAASKAAGSSLAGGDIITFLDDDDKYDPHYLEWTVGALDRYNDIEVLFVGVSWFGASAPIGERMHGESTTRVLSQSDPKMVEPKLWRLGPSLLAALLKAVPMAFQRPVIRSSILKRIGGYRSECLLCECDWALRAAMMAQCALLQEPLYQQRFDGQGYYSQNDRKKEHLESIFEITLHLYRNPPIQLPTHTQSLLRRAASDNAFDLAYFLSQQHLFKSAIRAWWVSQSIQFSLDHCKLPLGILARVIGLR